MQQRLLVNGRKYLVLLYNRLRNLLANQDEEVQPALLMAGSFFQCASTSNRYNGYSMSPQIRYSPKTEEGLFLAQTIFEKKKPHRVRSEIVLFDALVESTCFCQFYYLIVINPGFRVVFEERYGSRNIR